MQQTKTLHYVLAALGAAIIAVLAQLSIPLPFSPVPITGQTFAIGLVVTILGLRTGSLSVLLYILIGAAGAPVFSQMTGGLGIVVGPTGGYIVGFLPTAIIMGYYMNKLGYTYWHSLIANLIGMVVTLAFGTVWLKIAADLTWYKAFMGGVYPFIPLGIVKAALAAWLGIVVRNRLKSARLLSEVA
ncbi:hypothetical protein GCM10007425_11230 [Lysinibacillus alkalisoli]|uniref:Biotin transporter n=1 Tax=Lysinibacillus alkalisoli TaxID=1911548 RepID=A0A917G1P9_9BACI|nr:biotin transporter BioY [Lysinibacillus alkalisoli]GGG18495.1 hypothetical protein GCM10007425_11230 [Lysinibacillus alkalisoli]